jgi:pilus assembly protein CpaB
MNRKTRTLIVLVVALVAALTASYGAFRAMERLSATPAEDPTTPTVVAARPLPVGTLVTKGDVKVIAWPTKSRVPGTFTSVEQVVDRGTIMAVAENEPLSESKLAPTGAGAGLPPTIPKGMRAISIAVNDVIGVAGFVVPGSRVDVLVTVDQPGEGRDTTTRVVVNNVQVLTAGTRFDQEQAQAEGKPIPSSVVTLMVSPSDAERIALAQNQGKITLALRNPLDTAAAETSGARLASLLGTQTTAPKVTPAPKASRAFVKQAVAPPPAPAPKPYTVEAIRGAKRTEEVVR